MDGMATPRLEPRSFRDVWKAYISSFYQLRTCPRELWMIYLLKFCESYAYYVFSYSLIMYLSTEFGFSDEEAGWTYGLTGMMTSFYGFFIGFLIDNLGVQRSLQLGAALSFFSRLLAAVTRSRKVLLLIMYTTMPLGCSLAIPVMTIAIRRYTSSDKQRAVAYNIFYQVMNGAAMCALPMIDIFRGLHGSTFVYRGFTFTAYRLVILSGVFMTLIFLIIASTLIREINLSGESTTSGSPTTF